MYLYSKIMDLSYVIFFKILLSYIVFAIICSGYISQLYKKLQLALIMCTKQVPHSFSTYYNRNH